MVEYNQLRARLLSSVKCSSTSIKGKVYHIGNIGSYVKIKNHVNDDIICEVIAIQETERYSKTIADASFDIDSARELILRPIGILTRNGRSDCFNLGVSIYPSIYSDVYVVVQEDLDAILTGPKDEQKNATSTGSIKLGISKSLVDYPVNIEVDKFFNIHSAVLGNSGSGKSYTIAHILQSVLNKTTPRARFILFDTNGEYPSAFPPKENSEVTCVHYSPFKKDNEDETYKKFYLPYYLLNLDEWLAFLMASDRTQRPFWEQVLQECYRFHKIFQDHTQSEETSSKQSEETSDKQSEGTSDKQSEETSDKQSEGTSKRFTNYIKWRLYLMLVNLSNRVESDTSKMTAALGVVAQVEKLCTDPNLSLSKDVREDLSIFITVCRGLCSINYGDNKGRLSEGLSKFCLNSDNSSEKTYEGFLRINETDARNIIEEKLPYGLYFQDKFLRAAAEMILLEEEAKGNTRIREYTSTMFARLDFFLTNQECDFMRVGGKIDLDTYLSKTFGLPSNPANDSAVTPTQLITIDLSEIGNDVLELVTSVISRMIFDKRKKLKGQDRTKGPIHLVLDEAHRYIKKDGDYILRENIFERIAREGRKFSYYLLVSSQRPSELSPVVLSQCSNYIIHRIHNRVDLDFVTSVLPYFSDDYTTKIKQAVPGEALVFGNCVPMPLRVQIHKANPEPASQNCKVWEEWTQHRLDNGETKDSSSN